MSRERCAKKITDLVDLELGELRLRWKDCYGTAPSNRISRDLLVRCQVTKRKISGGTRSDAGRDCRDAFLGLNKTCAKLNIAFWDYLGARLAVPGSLTIPPLAEIVSLRAAQPP